MWRVKLLKAEVHKVKKRFCALISLVLFTLTLLGASACFADSSSVLVKTTGEVVYDFKIPASTTIPYGDSKTNIGSITPTVLSLESNGAVTVSVSSVNQFNMVNDEGNSKINYTLTADDAIFALGDDNKQVPVDINVEKSQWLGASGGKHRDVLTFEFNYNQINN